MLISKYCDPDNMPRPHRLSCPEFRHHEARLSSSTLLNKNKFNAPRKLTRNIGFIVDFMGYIKYHMAHFNRNSY